MIRALLLLIGVIFLVFLWMMVMSGLKALATFMFVLILATTVACILALIT